MKPKEVTENPLLTENAFLLERINNGIDIHPPESVIAEFRVLAAKLSPNQDFGNNSCLECISHLVKFVYENKQRLNA